MLTEPEGKGLAAKKKGRCQKHGQSLTCLLNGIWSPKPRLCSDDQLETQSLLWEFFKKKHLYLAGGWDYTSDKYEFVSWDDDIPNWMEK